MRSRRVAIVLAAVAAFVASGVIGAVPAAAKGPKGPPPSLSCTLTGSATISPGLSSTAAVQTITVTTRLSSCTGSSVPGITSSSSGTTSSTSKKVEDCAALGKKSVTKTVSTIDWNTGATSSDTYKTALVAGSATSKGKITSGPFAKGKLSASLTYDITAGQNCTSVPITSASLSGAFSIS